MSIAISGLNLIRPGLRYEGSKHEHRDPTLGLDGLEPKLCVLGLRYWGLRSDLDRLGHGASGTRAWASGSKVDLDELGHGHRGLGLRRRRSRH